MKHDDSGAEDSSGDEEQRREFGAVFEKWWETSNFRFFQNIRRQALSLSVITTVKQ
jgi:hypothetical protein